MTDAPALSRTLKYGSTPVPWTVSWSGEEDFGIGECPVFLRTAIVQGNRIGDGRPQFGKPHMHRQRKAIADGLCDLCGLTLKGRAKISLSHARPQPHGAEGWAILQVEPLLHKGCAAESVKWCPSLKRDIERGSMIVRLVTRWRAQVAVMSPDYVQSITGMRTYAIGHAKVELLQWRDCSPGFIAHD